MDWAYVFGVFLKSAFRAVFPLCIPSYFVKGYDDRCRLTSDYSRKQLRLFIVYIFIITLCYHH